MVAVFILLHLCIYGGATAYNSSYDRDSGPVGGMKHPPESGLLERNGGLFLQLLGAGTISLWGWGLGLCAGVLILMGTAYSHPRWRWKARPVLSLVVVAIGQGVIPFLIGYLVGAPLSRLSLEVWVAISASALLILGTYPLSQVYQVEEDEARGDVTFSVRYGPHMAFNFARFIVGAGIGALGLAIVLSPGGRLFWLYILPVAYFVFDRTLASWRRVFESNTVYENHDRSFLMSLGASAMFALLAISEIAAASKGLYE
jgi:1,4-dihydroxy-2-naphthoate octaprenyltransferase